MGPAPAHRPPVAAGNVAELENVIQRAVIMARGPVLEEGGDLVPADYVAQKLPFRAQDIFSLPLPEAEERLLASFHREYLRKSLAPGPRAAWPRPRPG